MSRVKEITDISKEIIKKLEEAITQTINARLFYEKYQSLLDQAKQIHEQKYIPLWNEVYNDEATTSAKEQEQLRELEKTMKNAWEKLGEAINKIISYQQEYPKSKTLRQIEFYLAESKKDEGGHWYQEWYLEYKKLLKSPYGKYEYGQIKPRDYFLGK